MKQKIIFRADGNTEIGLGHIIRSLALAEMLKNDFSCTFVTRFITDYTRNEILRICDNLIELDKTDIHFNQFLHILTGNEIVVLDNYFFDTKYQQTIKEKGCKLVCIDDIHDKYFVPDVVINHAGGINKDNYSVAPYTCCYFGTEYALLRPEFLQKDEKQFTDLSVFICMGGADKENATLQALQVLENKCFLQTCHVVIGDSYLHLQELQEFRQTSSLHIDIHKNLSAKKMSDVMSECRYAICPPSTVSYEYLSRRGGELYLKVIADNQKDIYSFYLNNKLAFDISELFVEDKLRVEQSIEIQKKYFDGKSPERLLSLFNKLENEFKLNLRKVAFSDIDLYFKWANDTESRRNALNPKAITYEEHVAWFSSRLSDKNTYLWILEENNIPIGQIRFDVNTSNSEAVISYSIDSIFRGKGLGLSILKLGIEKFVNQNTGISSLKGFVKQTNAASNNIFKLFNFNVLEEKNPTLEGFVIYHKSLQGFNQSNLKSI